MDWIYDSDWQLRYNDGRGIDGCLRLDFHEYVDSQVGRLVLHRGGFGFVDMYNVHYGHVRLGDLKDRIGDPVPSGDGRGAPADAGALYKLHVTPMIGDQYYKPNSIGSIWATYADIGGRFGGPAHYAPMCWSFLNVAGGGLVRSILADGANVRLAANVKKVKMPSWSYQTGLQNGWVWGAYVRASGLWGWIVWGHQDADQYGNPNGPYIPHVEYLHE